MTDAPAPPARRRRGPRAILKRMRFFNVAGPMDPEVHYTIPPLSRLDLARVERMVEWAEYFVLHAPRQTGKTSVLKALRDHLNERGWRCVYASCEDATGLRDPDAAARGVLGAISDAAVTTLGDDSLEAVWPRTLAEIGPAGGFREALALWSEKSGEERLVLLLDEVDALDRKVLVSLLAQLRLGYSYHQRPFPRRMVFCGLRDVRDYSGPADIPFNIVAETFRLADFSRSEVEELLGQHTAETGQRFSPEAVEEIWNATAGQPWLVNALAKETCFEDEAGLDRTREIGVEAVEAARERLFRERPSNIRHLEERLTDPRVRRVIEPILASRAAFLADEDDDSYVRDLGFVKVEEPLEIANPIYRDAIPRILFAGSEHWMSGGAGSSRRPDGGLEVAGLLAAFRQVFREDSEAWSENFLFREAAPHVLLQAFWQRAVKGGGRIVREYGAGRARTDLLVEWRRDDGGTQRFVVECKVRRERDDLETVIREGVAQTAAHLDRCGAEEGHLVVVDEDEGKTWDEKFFRRALAARRVSAPDSEPGWEVAPEDEPRPDAADPETRPILVWGM